MNIKQFIKQYRENWNELEKLISTLPKRKNKLSPKDIYKFNTLYKKASQHLSYSQTYFPNEEITVYLNGLVSQAHNLLYKDQTSSFKQIKHFFGTKFIGLLLFQWKFIIAAMILFCLGAFGSFLSVMDDPLHIHSILPENIAKGVDPQQIGGNGEAIDSPFMSAAIMTNNIQVAILAFASGVTFGLLTIYVLIYNGIIVGALAGLFWHSGNTYEFWAFIVPHGMVELTAIFIAGGAGLLMGYKLFVPGNYSRIYQLKQQAKHSVQLLLGTIPLFIIAGLIEGYITIASISLEAKYIVAFLTVIGMVVYMIIGNFFLNKTSKLVRDS